MQEQNAGKLNIIVAVYGLKTVTEQVSKLIIDGNPQTLHFTVNNQAIGEDGWRGQRKSITIVYNYDEGDLRVAAAREGDVITINPNKPKQFNHVLNNTSNNEHGLSVLAAT